MSIVEGTVVEGAVAEASAEEKPELDTAAEVAEATDEKKVSKLPTVHEIEARIERLKVLRDEKIEHADAHAKDQIEAVKAEYKATLESKIAEIKKVQREDKERAKSSYKAAAQNWENVRKALVSKEKAETAEGELTDAPASTTTP